MINTLVSEKKPENENATTPIAQLSDSSASLGLDGTQDGANSSVFTENEAKNVSGTDSIEPIPQSSGVSSSLLSSSLRNSANSSVTTGNVVKIESPNESLEQISQSADVSPSLSSTLQKKANSSEATENAPKIAIATQKAKDGDHLEPNQVPSTSVTDFEINSVVATVLARISETAVLFGPISASAFENLKFSTTNLEQ